MTKREFERIYCSECEMCAECTSGCPLYHEADDDIVYFKGDINTLVNGIIDLSRAVSNAAFEVTAIRVSPRDRSIQLSVPSVVKNIAELLGLEWEETEDAVRTYYAGVEICALYW